MPFVNRALLTLKRVLIVIGIAIAFSIGLIGAIVLSLHSSQTAVPNIVGKDRITAENEISAARLNFRVRATRPASDAQPNTVLIQIPSAGVVVKVGQTVAVDISRPTKESDTLTITSNQNTATEKKTENTDASNANTNANDNKPKKKPANANSNANANANGNRNTNRITNQNRNANADSTTSENENASETPAHNLNANRSNLNTNRRPPVVTPTPQF